MCWPRGAASRRTEEDLTGLREALDGRARAISRDDVVGFVEHDVQFHVGIAQASTKRLLAALYTSFEPLLRDSVARSNCLTVADDPHDDFHEALCRAIQTGNSSGATTPR